MQFDVGDVVEGKVTTITKFGAFINLGGGKSGLVHISEVASDYVNDVNEFLEPNQIVKVKILSIDNNGKLSLSIKRAQTQNEDTQVNQTIKEAKPEVFQRTQNIVQPKSAFEDKLSKFMKESDDRLNDLRKKLDPKKKRNSKPSN